MKFEILEPTSLTEAVRLLGEYGEKARLLAGGTDLLVKMKKHLLKVPYLMSLEKIGGLSQITYHEGRGLHIGALVTQAQVLSHPLILKRYRALALACQSVGSPQIRSLATVAGNLANASPSADAAPPLLVLNARVMAMGPDGKRELAVEDFFAGPGSTNLRKGEFITGIFIPEPLAGTRSIYLKLGRRRAMDIAICGVALAACPDGDRWHNCYLALGAVAPTPILARQAGGLLEGGRWDEEVVDSVGEAAGRECSPIDDLRASAAYRRDMVAVLTRRAVRELMQMA